MPAAVRALSDHGGEVADGEAPVAVLDQLKLEWHRFLDHLTRKGMQILVSHLHVRYDAERDACTKEKTVFTTFQELSETNDVVRFLISEFGGELIY